MAASKSTTSRTIGTTPTAEPSKRKPATTAPAVFTVPPELRARYDAATVTDDQVGAYWRAQDSTGPLRDAGVRIGSIDRHHPDADRRLVGPKDFPEYEHLVRLAKARKDHTTAERRARLRVDQHRPCEFCGRREPSGLPIGLPTGDRHRGCASCAPAYAAVLAEALAAAAGAVGGVDVLAAMRATARAEAAEYVAAREASWARLEADPNPLPAA